MIPLYFFTSLNSSFSKCITIHKRLPLSSLSPNNYSNEPSYEGCTFSPANPPQSISSANVDFSSCTFTALSSNSNGGAICFTNHDTGILTIVLCSFVQCFANISVSEFHGGGAVWIDSGSKINVTSSTFLKCYTNSISGAIYVQRNCKYSHIVFTKFISCSALHAGALSTYKGPYSVLSSSCFLSCSVANSGGGIYHDGGQQCSFTLSNCLFCRNMAHCGDGRSGGAFEDHRQSQYASQYAFSFFAGNKAANQQAHDILIYSNSLPASGILCCFTTAICNSFLNKGVDQSNWLPFTKWNVIIAGI